MVPMDHKATSLGLLGSGRSCERFKTEISRARGSKAANISHAATEFGCSEDGLVGSRGKYERHTRMRAAPVVK
jgi:hypothetical protein